MPGSRLRRRMTCSRGANRARASQSYVRVSSGDAQPSTAAAMAPTARSAASVVSSIGSATSRPPARAASNGRPGRPPGARGWYVDEFGRLVLDLEDERRRAALPRRDVQESA